MKTPVVGFSYFGHAAPGIVPMLVLQCGNGPWASIPAQIAEWIKANPGVPPVIFRGSPERPRTRADNGRIWTQAELSAYYRSIAVECARLKLGLILADDGEFGRAPVPDDDYYMSTVRPLLDGLPVLQWGNYAHMPGTLLGDVQSMYTPCLSMWFGRDPNPPTTQWERMRRSLNSHALCAATGKPVIPWLPALSNADAPVTRAEWIVHMTHVLVRSALVMLFDETRHTHGCDEGQACRDDVAAVNAQIAKLLNGRKRVRQLRPGVQIDANDKTVTSLHLLDDGSVLVCHTTDYARTNPDRVASGLGAVIEIPSPTDGSKTVIFVTNSLAKARKS